MTLLLNKTTLNGLPEAIHLPGYDFNARKASIVHIGIGAFHKAHQAVFTDDMMAKCDGNYKIIAVSLRSKANRDNLVKQDYLYTAVERSDKQNAARVIAALETVLVAPENPQAVVDALSSKQIEVVTTTITEKGYCLLPGNTGLDINHPDIQHDLRALKHPKTMIGFVVKASLVRMTNGASGFAFISCDNLPDNSQLAKKAILDFANQLNTELAAWIEENVSFCNSMVDRIVPAVQTSDVEHHAKQYGYTDDALVTSEPFRQWVIEDNFKTPRPPWDKAGVVFVDDVAKYEKLKLRFLNGSHSALAYLGKLTNHTFIHEAVSNHVLQCFVKSLMGEMKASLSATMEYDFDGYGQTIIGRFANSEIQYQTQQVATDGSQKLPQRIFAPLVELFEQQNRVSLPLCSVVAAWLMYLQGMAENGDTYDISDPLATQLTAIMADKRLSLAQQFEQVAQIDGLIPNTISQNSTIKDTILGQLSSFKDNGIPPTLTNRPRLLEP